MSRLENMPRQAHALMRETGMREADAAAHEDSAEGIRAHMPYSDELSTQIARHVVATLIECGVRTFIVCPGSRSAPFAYALYDAEQAGAITLHVETDERVAAFVALGCGLAGKLAACITTSGSAVANLHPAVEEAYYSCVPMILLTADRPYELHGCRANQTTDHRSVLHGSVRYFLDIPADSPADMAMAGHVKRSVRAARGLGCGTIAGPVHINCSLRPPFMPHNSWKLPESMRKLPKTIVQADTALTMNQVQDVKVAKNLAQRVHTARTVVIAAASTLSEQLFSADICAALEHVPVFAEPSSPLRALPSAICGYTCALHTPLRESIERVIVIGHPTLSREISALLADKRVEVYVVDESPTYADSTGRAQVISLADLPSYACTARSYLAQWITASKAAHNSIAQIVREEPELSWVHIAHALSSHSSMPVHIGASSIIRELNTYGQYFPAGATSNRGLAGIDGTLSTARGLSLAYGSLVRVCLGDLSFVYDCSSLIPVAGQNDAQLDVVVVDDGGGSLFSTLEYGQGNAHAFERVFRTRRALDMHAYAQACGAAYTCVSNYCELVDALDQPPVQHGASSCQPVPERREQNRIVHICMPAHTPAQMRVKRYEHAHILRQAIAQSA